MHGSDFSPQLCYIKGGGRLCLLMYIDLYIELCIYVYLHIVYVMSAPLFGQRPRHQYLVLGRKTLYVINGT